MSFQALEEVFERQNLTISKLRKFRKEHLQNLCKVKSIKISHNERKTLKEEYVQAIFTAVSGYKVSDTIAKERVQHQKPRESPLAGKQRTRDDGSILVMLSPMLKLV